MVDSTNAVLIVSACRIRSPFAKVRDEFAVVADIGLKLGNARGSFLPLRNALESNLVRCQVAQPLECFLGSAVPQ